MKKMLVVGILGISSVGCTIITANHPTDKLSLQSIKNICIEDNPKVIVPRFKEILSSSFSNHGISTRSFAQGSVPNECEYVLRYSAIRSWDFVTYLTDADLDLQKNGVTVSFANFHLKGGGGLAFTKWKSTESKVNLLVDELLGKTKKGS